MNNLFGICNFVGAPFLALKYEKIEEAVRAITGWETNLWEIMRATERSEVMMRVFNNREGFGPEDDKLFRRLHEPLPDGPDILEVDVTAALTALSEEGVFAAIHDVMVRPQPKDFAQGNVPRLDAAAFAAHIDARELPQAELVEVVVHAVDADVATDLVKIHIAGLSQSIVDVDFAVAFETDMAEEIYKLTALCTFEDRFVIPPMHREQAIEMMKEPHEHREETGFGFVGGPRRGL